MSLTRRHVLMAAAAGAMLWPPQVRGFTRTWAGGGVAVPALGLGTWQSFDVAAGSAQARESVTALDTFLEAGGQLVDTSPMYGRAEAALGLALPQVKRGQELLLASKIWTTGREAGQRQLAHSLRLLGRARIDLMQIHNLLDAESHFRTLQSARDRDEIRWLGITHYQAGAHAELEDWLKRPGLDSIQINYSLAEPQAGARLLPAARDAGCMVLINRPLAEGAMFQRVRGLPLPPVAVELGCTSFAQLFLKWILADPAVHCVLVGTRNPTHIRDNFGALRGPLPDPRQRAQIKQWWDGL